MLVVELHERRRGLGRPPARSARRRRARRSCERSTSRSDVFLTGTKRERGTRTARAPSKTPIAAPIAVSSWYDGRRGGVRRVDGLLVDDHRQPEHAVALAQQRGRAPRRSTHRLLTWKYGWRSTSVNASMSSSGVCAVSRRISPPVSLSTAMWPPLRSASRARRSPPHAYGRPSRGDPGEDARVEHRAEVVGVRHERVAVAALEQQREHPRRQQRRVDVAVARAGTTRGSGRAATRRASGRRRAASAPCAGRSRTARRRRGPRSARAARASRRACRTSSSARAAAGRRSPRAARAPGARSRRGTTARP